ncbi:tubulin-tyrosine ligase [Westerdykella ornata]|uniref:Tubulin-tyrosine ligase n=1 Tax=Westerdykella ornata TaxID=318751 RepID=A0A6A6JV69_WESOR|nr:tubulin-tyrosine ligase [Westerdykella ornata]KAF2280114.1 tubulin-tyrosine ligase [Westerdykella ornata]
MGSISAPDSKVYALIIYDDAYVHPILLAALRKRLPPSSYELITSLDQLPSPTSNLLQWLQYEEIDFQHHLSHPETALCNAYIIRKALIRKHYLSTTVSNWITKHPDSLLRKHVKPSVEFEVDYAEFLDDALVEAYELRESWQRGEGKEGKDREWWILKPGMSERGQGIRLFSSEEDLTEIFEAWDPEDDEEEEDEEEQEDATARSDYGDADKEENEGNGIITSQLRHFVAQPYIHPPLLLTPPGSAPNFPPRKFHIRTYVLAFGALKVYVYKEMLALFAARPYIPPWESSNDEEALRAHLTNTCLQDTSEREGSVGLFWDLPDDLPSGCAPQKSPWTEQVFQQILDITSETFRAAATSMSIHFQTLPNSFELFGLDFMVGVEGDGELRTYLLEVNAFPDFRQTGSECKRVVEGLMEGVVDVAVRPFFGIEGNEEASEGARKLIKVLDIDLGRR